MGKSSLLVLNAPLLALTNDLSGSVRLAGFDGDVCKQSLLTPALPPPTNGN